MGTGHGRCHRRSLKDADEAIRQARKDIPWLAAVPAQAAQAILKTYRRAWTLALSDGNDQTHGPWIRPKEAERLLRLERAATRKRRHGK